MRGGGWAWWLAIGAIGVALLGGLIWLTEATAGLDGRDDRIRLVHGVLLLVFLLSAGAVRWRRRPSLILKHALIWGAAGVILILGYSFRSELMDLGDRLTGELVPGRGVQAGAASVSFSAAADGHFHVNASIDGTPLRLMVDSGASVVVLRPEDARRIGLEPEKLAHTLRFATANGTVTGAPIRIREIRIGPIRMRDVRAAVTGAAMGESLLGQSFLERLSSYAVRNQTLTMHQ